MKINTFWFRRDLRLEDNSALNPALISGLPVLPVFIFDTNIISELPPDDPRISFIHQTLSAINKKLEISGSSLYVAKGDPVKVWKELLQSFDINAVYANKDYEPYAVKGDTQVASLLLKQNIPLKCFKDQVIFEEREILKSDNNPYIQQKKFDRDNLYVKKWAGDSRKPAYPEPVIDQDFARRRAIEVYKAGIKKSLK